VSFENFIKTLLEKLAVSIKTETIVGEPMQIGSEMTIIPITKVSFGFGVGGKENNGKGEFGGGSGGGATIEPIGFLVIKGKDVELVPLKDKDSLIDWLLDVKSYDKIGDIVDKLKDKFKGGEKDPKHGEADKASHGARSTRGEQDAREALQNSKAGATSSSATANTNDAANPRPEGGGKPELV
jgi:uncharacterized spore protein YtfJ